MCALKGSLKLRNAIGACSLSRARGDNTFVDCEKAAAATVLLLLEEFFVRWCSSARF